MCQFEARGILKLKGLCDDSVIDPVYSVVNSQAFIEYNGFVDTDIVYNKDTQHWNIIDYGQIIGASLASADALMLGA